MDSLQFQQKLIGIQDRLMNFALKLTANREDALDLLQDTKAQRRSSTTLKNIMYPMRSSSETIISGKTGRS